MASRSLTSFSLRLATVGPSLALLTSRSANRPLKSCSEAVPTDERLDVGEHPREGLVEVLVAACVRTDVGEKLTGQDEEALLGHDLLAAVLRVGVRDASCSRSRGCRPRALRR